MTGDEASNPWLSGDVPRGEEYDQRFERLAASGVDAHGEAAFIASLGVHSVLDAGCGTGRVAMELARRGIDCVGVDLDERMLAVARRAAPQLRWIEADLAGLDLDRRFAAVVLAGNVLLFVTPGTEAAVLERMTAHLEPSGLLVAGFSLDGRLALDHYDRLAAAAGLELVDRFATWDRTPFAEGSPYALSVHRRSGATP